MNSALANAFQRSLAVTLEGEIRTPAVITDDMEGEGWKRRLVARMILDPSQAKQASLRRLAGRLAEAQRNKSS